MISHSKIDEIHECLLVVRVQARDHAAFHDLVRLYERRLLYYIRRLEADPTESDDIFQEVWLTVFRKIPALRAPEAFRVWLYRIARDQIVNNLRRRGKESTLNDEIDRIAVDDDPHIDLENLEDAVAVHKALEALSLPHREVLTLRFLEDLPIADIAEVVGCGIGTVKSRLHYAKQALRQELESPQP